MGHYYTLLDLTMANFDERMFRNYTRLTPGVFLEVLDSCRRSKLNDKNDKVSQLKCIHT